MLTQNKRMAEKVSAVTVLNLQRIFPAYFHFLESSFTPPVVISKIFFLKKKNPFSKIPYN